MSNLNFMQNDIEEIMGDISEIEQVNNFTPFKSCEAMIRLNGEQINYHGEHIIQLGIDSLKFLVLKSIDCMNRFFNFSICNINRAKFMRLDNLVEDQMYDTKIRVDILEMKGDLLTASFTGYCGRYKFYEAKMVFELHTEDEYTLCIIKPDAVKAKHDLEILKLLKANDIYVAKARVNDININLLKRRVITEAEAKKLYSAHKDRPFFNQLVSFITSGESIIAVLVGRDAISRYRKIMGATNPEMAEAGTIRKMYAESIDYNAVHGSDSQKNAETEINIFFADFAKYIDSSWSYFTAKNDA